MLRITKLFRLMHINFILVRHGIDEIILATPWFAAFRFLSYLNPWNWSRDTTYNRGQRLRHALEELGPIFVKFGQMLSTRGDLLPDDISRELTLLQDRVPPFSIDKARNIIEEIYGESIEKYFAHFENTPLASASIAQVHAAVLPDGKEVIIKILRPNIKKLIKRDVALMYSIAYLAERFWSEGRRLRPREVVAEFEKSLLDELDLMREAANASQLRRNFANSTQLYVPEIYWDYVRHNILVMERIYGIRVSNLNELNDLGVDLKKLAERGVEIFFTQVFRDCFFHADMHPGNIFVSSLNPKDPQYIAIDFGIIGTLTPNDQRYLAENFLAFFKRDYRRVAELHIESGWVPYETRIDEFESAIRTVCEPVFQRPLKDISCGQILLRLFQTARRFNMEVQPQLVLLQKTLLNIEGLGRQLYPELDLWSTAKPFLERWLKQQVGVGATLRKISERLPFWAEKAPEIPDLLYNTLSFMNDFRHRYDTQRMQVAQLERAKVRSRRRGFLLGLGAALVVSVLLNAGVNEQVFGHYLNWLSLSGIFVGVGILALVFSRT